MRTVDYRKIFISLKKKISFVDGRTKTGNFHSMNNFIVNSEFLNSKFLQLCIPSVVALKSSSSFCITNIEITKVKNVYHAVNVKAAKIIGRHGSSYRKRRFLSNASTQNLCARLTKGDPISFNVTTRRIPRYFLYLFFNGRRYPH